MGGVMGTMAKKAIHGLKVGSITQLSEQLGSYWNTTSSFHLCIHLCGMNCVGEKTTIMLKVTNTITLTLDPRAFCKKGKENYKNPQRSQLTIKMTIMKQKVQG
jgi:hypothetical protein